MNYSKIKSCDIANGPGTRVSLFVSGCRNHCKGCFQPETWNFYNGEIFDLDIQSKIIIFLQAYYVQGLTILGGEPMEPENQEALTPFLRRVRFEFPEKDIWLYTGYICNETIPITNYTEIIFNNIDVLVDGPFIEEEKDITLRFKGSRNQRIIDMKKTREKGEIILWE